MPCYRRASAVTGAADQAEALVAGDGDGEDWVAPERSGGGAGPSADDDAIPTLGEEGAGKGNVRRGRQDHLAFHVPKARDLTHGVTILISIAV